VRPRRKPRSLRPVGVEVEVISRPFVRPTSGYHSYGIATRRTHTSHAARRVVLGSTLVRMAPTGRDACLQSASAQCRRGASDHPAAEDVDPNATRSVRAARNPSAAGSRTSLASPDRSFRSPQPARSARGYLAGHRGPVTVRDRRIDFDDLVEPGPGCGAASRPASRCPAHLHHPDAAPGCPDRRDQASGSATVSFTMAT
jgi:hypothetical protein